MTSYFRTVIVAAFVTTGLTPSVFCDEQNPSGMVDALDILKKSITPKALQSQLKPLTIPDKIFLLETSKKVLEKTPPVYEGHRAKAIEYVTLATEQLKDGEEGKSISNVNKAISEVRVCVHIDNTVK